MAVPSLKIFLGNSIRHPIRVYPGWDASGVTEALIQKGVAGQELRVGSTHRLKQGINRR